MATLTIRQVVLDGLSALACLFDQYRQFYRRASDVAMSKEFLRDRFNYGESTIFIAEMSGVPVGFTQLYPAFSSTDLARIFILNDLFLTDSARGSGVAVALLDAAGAYAQRLGAIRLCLETAVDNKIAQSLYQKQGWRRENNFYSYFFDVAGEG